MTPEEQLKVIKEELDDHEYYGLANDSIEWLLGYIKNLKILADEVQKMVDDWTREGRGGYFFHLLPLLDAV